MGLENRSYIANDNGEAEKLGRDDRMGFNDFLKTSHNHIERQRPKDTARPPHHSSRRRQTPPPNVPPSARPWAMIGALTLLAVSLLTAYLSLTSSVAASRLLGFTALIIMALIGAALSERKGAYRLQALCILTALLVCFGLTITLAQNFGLDVFNPSNASFWISTSLIALISAWSLRSRLALIISIALTVFWAYAVYTGSVRFGPSLWGLLIITGLQIITAQTLNDGFSRRLSQLVIYGWGLSALVMAAMSGLTSPPFIISALTVLTGLLYISSTHPFHIWAQDNSRGIALFSWFALMSCTLAAVGLWLMPPSALGISETSASPLMSFIWQLGLIAGSLMLFATALFRRTRLSHSLSRRLIGALLISSLAASHYFLAQAAITNTNNIGAIYMILAMVLLGGLSVMTANKFASAIRYGHTGCIILSFILILALIGSFVLISDDNSELLFISGISALVTIFGLSVSHKRRAEFQQRTDVYRPMKASKQQQPHANDAPYSPRPQAL